MLALSTYRVFLAAASKHMIVSNIPAKCFQSQNIGNTIQQPSQNTIQQEDKLNDMPIKMENPYKQPQKGCILCNVAVDYKNIQLLSQFISPHTGRIYGRHVTGLCGCKQREVTKAIKRARSMGFMSVTLKDPQFIKDPNICDIRHIE